MEVNRECALFWIKWQFEGGFMAGSLPPVYHTNRWLLSFRLFFLVLLRCWQLHKDALGICQSVYTNCQSVYTNCQADSPIPCRACSARSAQRHGVTVGIAQPPGNGFCRRVQPSLPENCGLGSNVRFIVCGNKLTEFDWALNVSENFSPRIALYWSFQTKHCDAHQVYPWLTQRRSQWLGLLLILHSNK